MTTPYNTEDATDYPIRWQESHSLNQIHIVVLDLVSRSLYIHTKEQYKSFGNFDFGKREFDFTLNYYNYFYFYLHYFICLFIFFFMDLVI